MPDTIEEPLDDDMAIDGCSRAHVGMAWTNQLLEDNRNAYVNQAFTRMTE